MGRIGITDISNYKYAVKEMPHDLAGQGCRGGLSVGSGDGDELSLGTVIGQLDLAPDGDPGLVQDSHKGRFQGDTRTDDAELHAGKIQLLQFSQDHGDLCALIKIFL